MSQTVRIARLESLRLKKKWAIISDWLQGLLLFFAGLMPMAALILPATVGISWLTAKHAAIVIAVYSMLILAGELVEILVRPAEKSTKYGAAEAALMEFTDRWPTLMDFDLVAMRQDYDRVYRYHIDLTPEQYTSALHRQAQEDAIRAIHQSNPALSRRQIVKKLNRTGAR